MPSLIAASATRLPMRPSPTTPSVWCGSSKPAKCFLPSSTCLSRSSPVGRQTVDEAHRRTHVAHGHHQAGEHEFLDGVGVRTRRVEHRRAALGHGLDRNVVRARTRTADGEHRRRDRHRVHVVRAHEDGVGRRLRGTNA
jgi:hypothetical protein